LHAPSSRRSWSTGFSESSSVSAPRRTATLTGSHARPNAVRLQSQSLAIASAPIFSTTSSARSPRRRGWPAGQHGDDDGSRRRSRHAEARPASSS
jgi:hypothetical protein